MNQPLEQRVDQVARQAIRLRRAEAICRALAATIAVIVVACTFDWLVRSQLLAVRWLVSTAVLAAVVFTVWRWVWPALRWRVTRLTVGRRIEARFPQLRDRLTSAIAFAGQPDGDPHSGSPELRRVLISETAAIAKELPLGDALDRRPLRSALVVVALTVVGLGVLIAIKPISARIALQRLTMPNSNIRWPLRHSLAVVDTPSVIAAGDDFELHVIDRQGSLPDDVRLYLRSKQAGVMHDETREMKQLGQQMVFRSDNVAQPFEYRVVGGDDHTMPWTAVDVVEPPRVVDLSLTVTPPSYSGLPIEQAQRIARVLAGSKITAVGKLDKPALAVQLRSDVAPQPNVAVRLAPDGLSFSLGGTAGAPWQPERSGSYWFELQDASGVPGGGEHRIELQVVADEPPTIAWEQPADASFVTPHALAPVRAFVKDDLRVQRVQLQFLRPDATDADEQVQLLYTSPGNPKAPAGEGQAVAIEAVWDLAATPGLQIGNVLAVHLVAFDAKPQSTSTAVRRLTIVSTSEFEQRIEQQQTSVFTQLAEALRLQRDAHNIAAAIAAKLTEVERLEPPDVDPLQAAELSQRQVERLLNDQHDGAAARLKSLLAQLRDNRIENPSLTRRLETSLSKVAQLNHEQLPLIAQQLMMSLKQARNEMAADGERPAAASIAPSLAIALSNQQEVIVTLEGMIDELAEWDNFSRLSREVHQLRDQQAAAEKETESLRWEIAAAPGEQPTSQHRATSRQMALKQQDLARRFDKTHARFEQLTSRLKESDPITAARLAEAAAVSRRLAIGANMRQAGRELNDYRAGAAQQTQRGVLQALGELLDALASRRDRDLQRTAQTLRAAAGELDELHRQQKDLASMLASAAQAPANDEQRNQLERLQREQHELAEKAKQLSRKLQRLQARKPAESTATGADSAALAAASAGAGDAETAQQQASEAARLLEAAQQQLQHEISQAKQDLTREQRAQLEQVIAGILERQKKVVAEMNRLEAERDDQQQLSPPAQASLATIAAQQQLLAEETNQLATRTVDAAALQLAIEGTAREMRQSASLLEAGRTDEPATRSAESAAARLEQVLQVLRETESAAPLVEQEEGANSENGQGAAPQDLAELRLLAELQNEINRRTVELETQRQQPGQRPAELIAALAGLAQEQGKLATIVDGLLAKGQAAVVEKIEIPLPDEQPSEKPAAPGADLDEQLLRDLLEKTE